MAHQLTCPNCRKSFKINVDVLPKSFTCDCVHCDSLLFFEDGKITDFHKTLHEQDSRWPADGKDTNWTEIS
jgi:hypothetical protein